MPRRFVNWARTARCAPTEVLEPASEAEAVEAVHGSGARGLSIKPVGAGHSWSEVACTGGAQMSLGRLCRVLEVDAARALVTAEAGIRLRDLCEALAAQELALPVVGSIAEQTLAGAIATATHGSAPRLPSLAGLVTALRLLLADGRLVEVSRETDPDLFAAARVSLGALGIITRVTLRCVPAFRLEELAAPLRFEAALEAIPQLVAEEEYVKLWWLPHTDFVQVFRHRPTGSPSTFRKFARFVDEALVNRGLFSLLLRLGGAAPSLIPRVNRLVRAAYFLPARRVARSDLALTLAMPPRHQEIEYALPVALAAEALRRTRALIERQGLRVNFVVELRFVAKDDAWLSPDHGRDSCRLGAYMARAPGLGRYFATFEEEMLSLGGRPHWGKQFGAGPELLRAAYPFFDRFAELRRRLDPQGMFDNDFLARLFPRAEQKAGAA